MNDNFIEEENTVYEIDPDCQIESLKKEDRRWKGQSCEPGHFPNCGKNDRQEENRNNHRERNHAAQRDNNMCQKENHSGHRDNNSRQREKNLGWLRENNCFEKKEHDSCFREVSGDCKREGENDWNKEEKKFCKDDNRCLNSKENHWPWKEDNNIREKCQRTNGCTFNWYLLLLLLCCFCKGE